MKEAKLRIRVQPGARRNEVVGLVGGVLRVRVAARPEGGKANEAVVALLAETLGIAKSRVRLLRGHTSREKVLSIEGVSKEELETTLSPTRSGI